MPWIFQLKMMEITFIVYNSHIGCQDKSMPIEGREASAIVDRFYPPAIRLLVCHRTRLVGWDHENLSAPYWRIYWNEGAGASVRFEGRSWPLGPSRWMAIPPNTPYATRLERPVVHLYLHFLAAPLFTPVPPSIFSFPIESHVRSLIGEIVVHLKEESAVRLSVLCHELGCEALRRIPVERLAAVRRDERVETAIRTMERRLDRPVSNSELARQAGMNPNAFARLFKGVTGQTPQAFFASRRIDHACVLLHGGRRSIKEVAEATGFCDRYHFSRVFRKLRGMGPAAFRRLARPR
jgi:AraC-like DNA-binding protein